MEPLHLLPLVRRLALMGICAIVASTALPSCAQDGDDNAAGAVNSAPREGADETMNVIKLESKTMLDAMSPYAGAIYQHSTGLSMIGPKGYSADNGQTWEAFTPGPDFDSALPKGYRRGKHAPWLDPVEDRILVLVNSMDTPHVDPTIHEPPEAMETYYLRYRVSVDGGRTYLFDEPIVQQGEGYSAERPLEGIIKNKNAFFLGDAGNKPIRLENGNVLVPIQASVLGPDEKLSRPGGGYYWLETIILIGAWQEDGHIVWDVSQRLTGDPDRTARGLYEGTLAQVPNGRVLLVMRGSNAGKKDPNCQWPSHKWYAVSEDSGKTWTDPTPWKYSDGSSFYSPSSMSVLMKHSSGKIFWVGNISPNNPRANHPRWPLVMGQVDPETLGLMKGTVITIDTKLPEEDDVNLSHANVLEDRQTGNIIIATSRASKGYKSRSPVVYVVSVAD